MGKFIFFFFAVILAVFLALPQEAAAVKYLSGTLILVPDGTIHIVAGDEKRPFPSAEVYFSYGYEFVEARAATADELALPGGPVMTYADGTLVKGSAATVYVTSDGKKRPFTSASVFTKLGYSFKNVLQDTANLLPQFLDGQVINTEQIPHPVGTLVNQNGGVYLITSNGKTRITSQEIFYSYHFDFKDVVLANTSDKSLFVEGQLDLYVSPTIGPPAPAPAPTSPPTSPPPPPPYSAPSNLAPSSIKVSGITGTFPETSESFTITATDPEGDLLTVSVNWADSSSVVITSLASGSSFTSAHSWTYIGTYNVSITVSDSQGGSLNKVYPVIVDTDPTVFGPAVTVLTPNGGESYAKGAPIGITWQRNWTPKQSFNRADVYHSRAGLNQLIKSDLQETSYSWIPENLQAAENYKIVIISHGSGAGTLSDQSDAEFSIAAN